MIRTASRFDFEDITDMFIDFAKDSAWGKHARAVEFDREHIEKVLLVCQHAGFILVAEKDDELVGFLIAVRQPDIWYPGWTRLQELIWYVKPEHRSGTIGGRLFKEYCLKAESLIAQGIVQEYSTTRMSTTRDLGLERRGFELKEHLYIKGAA